MAQIDQNEARVLQALENPKFHWRTLNDLEHTFGSLDHPNLINQNGPAGFQASRKLHIECPRPLSGTDWTNDRTTRALVIAQ